MYFLCGNANKIYLEALWRRHAVLQPCLAENVCEWKMSVENVCPESSRKSLPDGRVAQWLDGLDDLDGHFG